MVLRVSRAPASQLRLAGEVAVEGEAVTEGDVARVLAARVEMPDYWSFA